MAINSNSLPNGNSSSGDIVIHSTIELGRVAREQRKRLSLIQLDIAGMANTGNRFIVELEQGKPTVQLQKVLDILDLLGLEMVIRHKAPGAA
jgi:HTH-type transcriptional regulator/antitoxin HipB